MSRRGFDRFMIDLEIGRNLKLRPLTDGEWRAFVAGVLPIAAKSPIRGCLLIGDRRAEPDDVAAQAGVKLPAARSALRKLRQVSIVFHDNEFDCDRVHDFEDWNPAPKKDATAAERQARRRSRLKAERDDRDADRDVTPVSRRDTRDGHTTEVEEEGKRTTASTGAMDQSAPALDTAIGGNGLHVVGDAA